MNSKIEEITTPGARTSGLAVDAANAPESHQTAELQPIGELARQFGVTLRALRFYEDRGLLKPKRVGSSRYYTTEDRRRLEVIVLGKRIGMSIDQIREFGELSARAASTHATQDDRGVLTERFRQQLSLLEQRRRDIDTAIEELHQLIERS